MRKFFYILLCAFFFVSCFSHGNNFKPVADITDTGDTVSDDTGDTVTDTGDTVTDTGDTVPDDVDTVPDDVDTVPDDADTVSDDIDTVPDDSDTVPNDGDTISDDIDTDDDDDTDDDSDYQEEFDDFDGETIQIRIVTGNITSGNNQSYDPGHGIRIFQALKPDIALVQEMNYKNNSANDYKEFAQEIVGTNYYAVDSADYDIPNGVVSKYPIKSSGYWDDPNIDNRALMWAVVDIPGEKDIFAISVHLHTDPASDQVKAAQVIVDEIGKLESSNSGRYYYVVGGDFNGTSAVSLNGFGKNNTFYISDSDPVDEKDNSNTNRNRNKQYDFVLADYHLHEFQVPVVYYSSEDATETKTYENGLVFDTRVYDESELNEYFYPAQTNDSGASSMQHMAVVKDFLIKLP